MKKFMITTDSDSRKQYLKPWIEVCQMKINMLMLVTSKEDSLDVNDDEDWEWPTDPETDEPYNPW
jgi:hypothetical protein